MKVITLTAIILAATVPDSNILAILLTITSLLPREAETNHPNTNLR
jgi:hypothetical protein